ncbi:MAG: BPTI/Kunitz domain-containing protein [Leptospiraceae bacterium]|nr:BPTI/Kunitz domain-containing protein [Leptospiraceae bacterium]
MDKYIHARLFIAILLVNSTFQFCKTNSKNKTINQTIDTKERCSMLPDGGPCRALIPGFYYDADSNNCLDFNYGGCKGSLPFKVKADCIQHCVF